MKIRPVAKKDVSQLKRIIKETPEFDKGDISTCFECLEAYLGGDKTYYFDCAEDNGELSGFVCYGWDTIAKGVLEFYWITVDKKKRREGIARLLQLHVEKEAKKKKSRIIFAETESDDAYANTRKFYKSCGYVEKARVKDFYSAGNDKIIYGKAV